MKYGKKAYMPLKILHDTEKIGKMREGVLFAPTTIRIDLNTVCNHDCEFCLYQSSGDGLKGVGLNTEMPTGVQIDSQRLIELISEFASCGVKSLVFLGGGEPTIHPDLESIIEATNRTALDYGLITNGSRLDRMIPYIASQGFKWFRVSLDAATEDTWNKVHRPSGTRYGFNFIIDNLRNLRNQRSDFLRGLSFIVGENNHHEVYQFIRMAKELGVDNVRIGMEYGPGFERRANKFEQQVVADIARGKTDFEDDTFAVFDKFENRLVQVGINKKNYTQCRFQNLSTNLGADLSFYTCCFGKYHPRHRIGSVRDISFQELWFVQRLAFLSRFELEKCPPCWYDSNNELLEYLTDPNPLHVNFVD